MRAVAAGRKAFLFVGSERAGDAAAIYHSLVESCKANKINPPTYLTYILSNVRNKAMRLPTPDEFGDLSTAPAGRCALYQSEVGSRVREDADYRTGSFSVVTGVRLGLYIHMRKAKMPKSVPWHVGRGLSVHAQGASPPEPCREPWPRAARVRARCHSSSPHCDSTAYPIIAWCQ